MSGLRQAGGSRVEIIGMRYYDPELADWLAGRAGQALAQASVGLLDTSNGYQFGCSTSSSARTWPTCSPRSGSPTSPTR